MDTHVRCLILDTRLYTLPRIPLFLTSHIRFHPLALFSKLLQQRLNLFEELSHLDTERKHDTYVKLRLLHFDLRSNHSETKKNSETYL